MAKQLPQAAITAASLRRMAKELILQAEELEASVAPLRKSKRVVEFIHAPKRKADKR
ncbi:MAG: hypothetical protein WBB19_02000 [Desulforhopalus sp.]